MMYLTIIGYIGADAEMTHYTDKQGNVRHNLKFRVASNKRKMDKNGLAFETTHWVTITKATGENDSFAKHLKKGTHVLVTGDYDPQEYEDKFGNKKTSMEVFARTIDILNGPYNKEDADKFGKESSIINVLPEELPF